MPLPRLRFTPPRGGTRLCDGIRAAHPREKLVASTILCPKKGFNFKVLLICTSPILTCLEYDL